MTALARTASTGDRAPTPTGPPTGRPKAHPGGITQTISCKELLSCPRKLPGRKKRGGNARRRRRGGNRKRLGLETTLILASGLRSLLLGLGLVELMILMTSILIISTRIGEPTRKRRANRKTCLILMLLIRSRRIPPTLSELLKEEVILWIS